MHSAHVYEEVETLLGEDGPSTEAFQNLTHAQRIAVLMLSRGAKHTDVALELDRSVRTLQYWLTSPNFRQALHEATSALLKEASAHLHSKMGKAIERLERIAQDPGEPASARVAANKALVTLALRMDNTIERGEQIQLLREEQQQVLAALQAEKSAHTCKTAKNPEVASESSSTERSNAVQSSPGAAVYPSVPYVPSIPEASYATASADRSHVASPPARTEKFLSIDKSLESFPSLSASNTEPKEGVLSP